MSIHNIIEIKPKYKDTKTIKTILFFES